MKTVKAIAGLVLRSLVFLVVTASIIALCATDMNLAYKSLGVSFALVLFNVWGYDSGYADGEGFPVYEEIEY